MNASDDTKQENDSRSEMDMLVKDDVVSSLDKVWCFGCLKKHNDTWYSATYCIVVAHRLSIGSHDDSRLNECIINLPLWNLYTPTRINWLVVIVSLHVWHVWWDDWLPLTLLPLLDVAVGVDVLVDEVGEAALLNDMVAAIVDDD